MRDQSDANRTAGAIVDAFVPLGLTLGRLANEYEPDLPRAFRFLTRGLGTRETRSNDMLSLVMFQSDYVRRLMELGEADASARIADIRQFLTR